MLDHAWIIPAIPAVSFVLILFFGKRLPKQGRRDRHRSRSARRSCCRASPRRSGSTGSRAPPGTARASRALGRGVFGGRERRRARRGGRRAGRAPVTWWQNGGVEFGVGTRIDGLVVMMLVRRHADLAARAHLLDGVHARRRPLHALLRDAVPLHRVDAPARRRRQHAPAARRLGAASASARSCSSATGGRRRRTPTPRSRRSSPPAPATSA